MNTQLESLLKDSRVSVHYSQRMTSVDKSAFQAIQDGVSTSIPFECLVLDLDTKHTDPLMTPFLSTPPPERAPPHRDT